MSRALYFIAVYSSRGVIRSNSRRDFETRDWGWQIRNGCTREHSWDTLAQLSRREAGPLASPLDEAHTHQIRGHKRKKELCVYAPFFPLADLSSKGLRKSSSTWVGLV